jgi:hypothetical protein
MTREMRLFEDRVYGVKVSDYGLERGYLDYKALTGIIGDCILNNYIFEFAGYENWYLENGSEETEDGYYLEVFQYYIITDSGARFLKEYTDEIVYYHEELDMYIWAITHFGTSWDYVLTDIRLVKDGE